MRAAGRVVGVLLLIVAAGVVAFHVRVANDVSRPTPSIASEDAMASGDSYYFAYGTNMSTRYLYNVRGILPKHSEAGSVRGYEVRLLSPGLNGLEPAFAYLVKADSKIAYGVVHRVTGADLAKIKDSEGASYEWATVPVQLKNGQVIDAQSLVRLTDGQTGKPSKRYLNFLIEGATEHGLPQAYIAKLKDTPSVYVPVASELEGDVIMAVVMKRSGKCSSVLVC